MSERGRVTRVRRGLLVSGFAALAVSLGAVTSFHVLGTAASRGHAAVLVGEVPIQAPIIVDAVFTALDGTPPEVAGPVVQREEAKMTSELRDLRAIGAQLKDVSALSAATQRFFAGVDLVHSRIVAGDLAGANRAANGDMVDAQSALTLEDGVVLTSFGTASSDAATQARVGVVGLLIATVLSVVALLLVGDRRRRRERDAVSAHFESLVHSSSDVIAVTDVEGLLTYASPSLYHTLGYTTGEVGFFERIHGADLQVIQAALEAIRASPDHSVRLEFNAKHHDGRTLTLEATVTNKLDDVEVSGFLWNARDISDRKTLEDQLSRQALQDPLTGLANRIVFRDRLSNALARAARHNRRVGLLMLDLDGFKEINDAAGHEAGDSVLIEVAVRLRSCLRAADTVARLGGDEFAMVIDDQADGGVVDEVGSRVLAVLGEPFRLADRKFWITASAGKVMCAGDADPDEALRQADIAMYAAKAAGKARVVAFEPAMAERLLERRTLAHDLEVAAESGQLVVRYQPTVDLKTGVIQGAEALVRWNHPTKGYLPPLDFIPLAEETGAIISIGRWVLDTACRQAARWERDPGMAEVRSVSVNVSGVQLANHNLLTDVREALQSSGLSAERLTLEITESVLMKDGGAALPQLNALKALGVSLAIDDFGTGYSSLSYLRRFPIDILKIDKSFVDSVAHQGTALATAIVNMGVSLQMKTVAEGIEHDEQASMLRELGCDIGQGFLFAKPIAAVEFEDVVKSSLQRVLASAVT